MIYADGAVIEYDRETHQLNAVLPDGATTELVSDGGVTIIGDVIVTGNIKATGEVIDHTRSMKADRDIYNSHTHSGVKLDRYDCSSQSNAIKNYARHEP